MFDTARESAHRIVEWGYEEGIEVVEAAVSMGGLAGGEYRITMGSDVTPPGRLGGGVGWTVDLPNGRHYGALREIVIAVDRALPTVAQDRLRAQVVDVAEAEVARELASLTDWNVDGGASIRHLTDADFYGALVPDIVAAQESIAVLAPFLGHRLGELVDVLIDAATRGLEVDLLVRPQYAAKATVQQYLEPLRAGGVRVTERTNRVHEKLVVIDKAIAYHGSLNPLSHKFTNESMVRFACPPIAEGFYVLYHPASGQSFAERIEIDVLPGGGRAESRTAWGEPPLSWKLGQP